MTKTTKGNKPTPRKPKAPAASKKASGASSRARKVKVQEAEVRLTDLQLRFVEHYLVDLNATQAAIRAGYSERTARQMGAENLSKPVIQAAIAAARLEQQKRTQITADRVLREAWNQVTADARELTQLHVGCCRYCHGIGHRFQRTDVAYENDYQDWLASNDPDKGAFKEAGGPGYHPNIAPHPGCPECGGNGVPRTVLMDTRKLSEKAASLFAGVKEGKFGIEIQMHSKDAAMEKLFKHLGLYEKDNEQKTDPLTSLLHAIAKNSSNAFTPVADDPEHNTPAPGSAFTPVDED
ncbi:terminase small subunit [Pseudomonas sp. PI1]|uniref:terminase small subunit n=1 Tax=Pseudomonas sp. PI1 TaxID=1582493 RepID=UPI0009E53237|nr:terminase small subunit [Pseudomonas sp. PI1]